MDARARLAAVGIAWLDIPAGRYIVGATAHTKLMAKPPQFSWSGYQLATPERWIDVDRPFAITQKLVTTAQLAQLSGEPELFKPTPDSVAINLLAERVGVASSRLYDLYAAHRPAEDDGVAEVAFASAQQIAADYDVSLPRWYEWEIAMRGPEPFAYAWGNRLDLDRLELQSRWYADGTRDATQHLVTITSFGPYARARSPWGLEDVARIGREWNLCHEGLPLADEPQVVRSASDCGAMAYMVPGIRPGTGGIAAEKERAFSGPVAACYGHANPPGHPIARGTLWMRAAFRFVIRG